MLTISIYRYVKEWEEYKKTDAYKEFRKQQLELKDASAPKKTKHNTTGDTTATPNATGIVKTLLLLCV